MTSELARLMGLYHASTMGNLVSLVTTQDVRLTKRSWFQLVRSPISNTFGAASAWGNFLRFCVDCPPNDEHCYGSLYCVCSAISTVYSTAMAYYEWAVFVTAVVKRDGTLPTDMFQFSSGNLTLDFEHAHTVQKRDQEISIRNVTALIAGKPKFLLDLGHSEGVTTASLELHPSLVHNATALRKRDWQDDGHQYSSGGGLKFNVCPVHPEHHLTVQYDWDAVWADDYDHLGDYMAYYNVDMAAIDMNDYQPGGWRTLMHTGKLIFEEDIGFGTNFETCDRDAFSGIAH
ncbi:hypothetical protein HG536_0C06560 [Torulaspora globosa]|uniref:Uncharacterized protein n=1 Tax=Torulaspora globosa TaxID=48254 RepID=A0A7G3ZG50_9SACH|nr:uncharacterized protein HG536_0C06560 [Torulaspora globosa]QLL32486.1 hypothetical protein HG536_0C06560 [Torulaspora globosa]